MKSRCHNFILENSGIALAFISNWIEENQGLKLDAYHPIGPWPSSCLMGPHRPRLYPPSPRGTAVVNRPAPAPAA